MSAIGAAHQLFSLALLGLALRTRTGTTAAMQALLPPMQAWQAGRPPTALLDALVTFLAAALAGHALACRLDGAARRILARIDARHLSRMALAFLCLLVLTLCGPLGLALLAASATVGLLPLALGVRRVHLTGALLAPALLARLGATA